MSGATHDDLVGSLLAGRYRIDVLIAHGGMATVWGGVDEVLDRPIAVKVMHSMLATEDVFLHRFRREAVAVAQLNHPNIVGVHDAVEERGLLAIVMELVDGPTLKERMTAGEPLTIEEAVDITVQVAEALEYAHEREIIHRDVKPANILLTEDDRAVLTDFGIAKAARTNDLTQGAVLGSVKYIAPERLDPAQIVDGRSDVYSLGVVLYEMLCGEAPFIADDEQQMAWARLHRLPPRPSVLRPDIPDDLDEIVMRALATEAADRFPSAESFARALGSRRRRIVDMAPIPVVSEAEDDDAPVSVPPPSRLERQIEALVVSLIIFAAIVLALVLLDTNDPGDPDTGEEPTATSLTTTPEPSGGGSDRPGAAIAEATAFDPDGDGREHDSEARFAIDGTAGTAWRTEQYNDRDVARYKGGVGLVVRLERPTSIRSVAISSPVTGWSAQLFATTARPTSRADLGSPIGSFTDAGAGTTAVATAPTDALHVVVWLTDLGRSDGRAQFALDEITINAG